MIPANLSLHQQQAAGRYGEAYGAVIGTVKTRWRVGYSFELQGAQRALSADERAIMDLIAGRGWTVERLSKETGRSRFEVGLLYDVATRKLAQHYEQVDAA